MSQIILLIAALFFFTRHVFRFERICTVNISYHTRLYLSDRYVISFS